MRLDDRSVIAEEVRVAIARRDTDGESISGRAYLDGKIAAYLHVLRLEGHMELAIALTTEAHASTRRREVAREVQDHEGGHPHARASRETESGERHISSSAPKTAALTPPEKTGETP